jgi:lysophospholipid acyltransferase (LPLAT)-like uncharacterized protein
MSTVKYKEPALPKEMDGFDNYIVAHFHQDELALVKTRINSSFVVMTSKSTDGEMMTRFLRLLGYICVRGSSKKSGDKALIEMIHILRSQNLNAVVAVDGPRGPIYKVKQGVVLLAKQTGLPILPVAVEINKAFCISKSWNKALIPKPFSTVNIHFGNVIKVAKDIERNKIDEISLVLEKELRLIKNLRGNI